MGKYIFISYCTKNQAWANAVRDILIKYSIPFKRAPEDMTPGAVFLEEITRLERDCAGVLFLLTEEAQESDWVKDEITVAKKMKKKIIPIQQKEEPLNDFYTSALASIHIHTLPTLAEHTDAFRKWIEEMEACVSQDKEVVRTMTQNKPVLDNALLRNNEFYDPREITEIKFHNTTSIAPRKTWDFSLLRNGSVKVWIEGTCLHIAGERGVMADKNAHRMFAGSDVNMDEDGFDNLKAIEFKGKFDTSQVTDMSLMFGGCGKLKKLNLNTLDTSLVTNMSGMFGLCSSLTELNLSKFDTSNVTDMSGMFSGCSSLTELHLSKFDTSNVTDMRGMFSGCSSLTELNLSKFDTSNVTDMRGMFFECRSLTGLHLSNFDTSNVTDMASMFTWCSSLTELNLSKFDTSNVTDMEGMFSWCSSLTELNLSNFDTSNVTNMSWMFSWCSSLTELNLSKFGTSNVTDMEGMFSKCSSLTELNLSNFDTSNVTDMAWMFSWCTALTSLDTRHFIISDKIATRFMYRGIPDSPYIYKHPATI